MSDSGHQVVANRVWFRLLRLQARLNVAIAERLREIGVSVPQCDVLTTLTEREGITQQELAQRLYVTKGNISGLIDRLEAAGFVERRATVGDRRSHAIYLTEAGRKIALAGIDIQRNFVEASFGRMPPEHIAAFEKMLVDVRDIVRELNGASVRPDLRRR